MLAYTHTLRDKSTHILTVVTTKNIPRHWPLFLGGKTPCGWEPLENGWPVSGKRTLLCSERGTRGSALHGCRLLKWSNPTHRLKNKTPSKCPGLLPCCLATLSFSGYQYRWQRQWNYPLHLHFHFWFLHTLGIAEILCWWAILHPYRTWQLILCVNLTGLRDIDS